VKTDEQTAFGKKHCVRVRKLKIIGVAGLDNEGHRERKA